MVIYQNLIFGTFKKSIFQNFRKEENKPENPFQTMTSQKIANVILPDPS